MRKLLFLFLFATGNVWGQPTATLIQVAQLPFAANESSGLLKNGPNSFWTHNDSGGLPELYEFDSTGTLTRTLQLSNCSNTDWEDLSMDAQGRIYIGDFGNNFNFRQTLSIYRIPPPSSISGNTFAVQDTIRFFYPGQSQFPPPVSEWNYDMEAMAVFQDSVYLFTKNRTNPYTGYSRLYVIPAQPGLHAAALRDSIFTGIGTVDNFSITGAAIRSDGSRLILMSNLRFWLLSNFSLPNIFTATKQEFIFNSVSQKEGVAIDGDSVAWFTDEGIPGLSGNLYRLYGDSLLTLAGTIDYEEPDIWPNPFDSAFNIRLKHPVKKLSVTDPAGKIVMNLSNDQLLQNISALHLKSGLYFLRTENQNGFRYQKLIRL